MKNDAASRRVLVSAGAEKQALATVRSLGRAGFTVDVLSSQHKAPSFVSRWCDEALVSPPSVDERSYLEFLVHRVRAVSTLTVLACDDVTATLLSRHRDRFLEYTRLAVPPAESFERATDKAQLVQLADELGLPTPRTVHPRTHDEAMQWARELEFPLIVKGAHGWGAQHVRLVQTPEQFAEALDALMQLEHGRVPMLQEFIPGVGYGVSTLFRHGEARALFTHRRVAEYDVRSQDSPYSCPTAVSCHEPELVRLTTRLFEALSWHGLGMAEWRRDARTGGFYLMEVNPRLVGSTDLAIRCGVDLPALQCRLVLEGDVQPVLEHRAGVRIHWLLPDGLHHVLARPWHGLRNLLRRGSTDWSWSDLRPHWLQLRLAAWELRHASRTAKSANG
jgi:predicted ATP-grasp superfamily ATP-dependent carboligase